MSLIKGIGSVLGGIGKALGGIGRLVGGILNSPIGALLKMAFPPLAGVGAAASLVGMMGSLAENIGGGAQY